ncbi:hypothetical protein HS7_11540 [Sulfolobales archaeon HS-7]|nr:hypothetical protein HS7_11540 [Sulfolobales archaeon HS-7]
MTAKLKVVNLTKTFNKRPVLDNVSIEVNNEEFFVILGPSGEGKSTLLRVIAGIEEPDEGEIYLDGEKITNLPPNKRNIAFMFQNYALYPNMNVYDNIAYPLKLRKIPKEEIAKKVNDIAQTLNIKSILEKRVTQLSGGQQQRVALARALVRNPRIFLLDEPLSNVDPRTKFLAIGLLRKIKEEFKQTVLYVTHNHAEAAALSTRVGVLHNGKFEQIDTFSSIYERPLTKWIGEFVGEVPMNFLRAKNIGLDFEGEVGFRAEWVDWEGDNSCLVESLQLVGDSYYAMCRLEDDLFAIKARSLVNPGERIKFSLNKYNLYLDGKFYKGPLSQ